MKAEEDDDLGEGREQSTPTALARDWGFNGGGPGDASDGTPKVWICSGDHSGSQREALWRQGQKKDQASEAEA